jgi:uncharacterized membrane protein
MRDAYLLNVTVHVLAALLWLGGMLFLAVVGAPVLRAVEPPALRTDLFRRLGRRFRWAGWWAITVLVVTGILNLHLTGVLSRLGDPALWSSRYGHALAWKLASVAVMIAASAAHDFVLGPAAARLPAGTAAAHAAARRAAWLGRVNALVGLVLVFAAVLLARGG